ncbi:protein phosphatase 1 regulatory subunit 32 [Indicator indicator]|uniref:protein phosphatase 1 regulatory subunit 32 n=1 Tax=Indicator indicator TaxID=1002788 RepID=UPI0023DF6714|nr:protein phosphatase 1 regulatory subunit 32 [Indicator indicator]
MACPFACPRGKLRSLPPGLATGFPSPRLETGGSSELMNFYTTSYTVAHGQPRFRPRLGHHAGAGFVPNNYSALSYLLCPPSTSEGHCQDIATSTTTKHFKPLWLPDGRSFLPRHVHQPGSGYLQECPPACLCTEGLSPQHAGVLQGPPKTSRERGTEKHHTGPARPDILQKVTIGAKEQSGFTRAIPRTKDILPALPGQPLGLSVTRMDYVPSVHSHGRETLAALPLGSERGSGFTREVPSSLGTVDLPMLGHQGLQAPGVTHSSFLGCQRVGRTEPSGFTTNYSQNITFGPTLSPTASAHWCQDSSWTARPMGGIQPQRPSGFSTNNHTTGLGDTVGHLLA